MKQTWFERAIFLSWYCSTPDCKFCYMSTMKGKAKRNAKRSLASVLAEAYLAKKLGWKIEFITAGTGALTDDEMLKTLQCIFEITGEKHYLNFGALNEGQIKKFLPYIKGYCGTIECIDFEKREKLCPTKPLKPILETLKLADRYRLEKAITIIIGVGETKEDVPKLIDFIGDYKIDKLVLYALNPHKGTPFKEGPEKEYYLQWLKEIRRAFPNLYIVAGPWVSRVGIIHELLESGATSITKFPAIKIFSTETAKKIEDECRIAGFEFQGTFTKIPEIDLSEIESVPLTGELKSQIRKKTQSYLLAMQGLSCKGSRGEASQQQEPRIRC